VAEVDRVEKSRFGLHVATLPLMMMPPLTRANLILSRYQSELGSGAILLAAERHRGRMGDWPASIAAIDRAILPSPPVDPFSGQSFRVEHRDGQFLVYSIGPDLEDQHGEYDPRMWMDGGRDDIGTGAWDPPLRRQPPHE
jgi:hypothetical protein